MTIRDGMSAKLKRITSAFQKMERAARSADKATQAVNPGRTLENSASLIDRARKRLDAFINRQRDAGKGAEEVSDAWSRTEGLIRKALAVFSVAAVKGSGARPSSVTSEAMVPPVPMSKIFFMVSPFSAKIPVIQRGQTKPGGHGDALPLLLGAGAVQPAFQIS